MFNLGNLQGTIMLEDTPLVLFKFVKDRLVYKNQLSFNSAILPFEFKKCVNEEMIRNFFYFRITPETRIGLEEDMKKHGIEYYDPETLIRYQKGRTFADAYWLDTDLIV